MDSWIYFVASLLWIISNETWTTSRTCVCMLLHFDLESLISESYFFRCEFLMFMKSMMILIFFGSPLVFLRSFFFYGCFFCGWFFLWQFFRLFLTLFFWLCFFYSVFFTLLFRLCFFVFDFVIIFSYYNFSFAFQTLIFFHCVPKTMLFPKANNPKANRTESVWVCCFEIFDHLFHCFSSFKFQSNNGHCLDLKSTTILTSLHFSNNNNNNHSKVNRLKRSWHSLQYQDCKYSNDNQ